MQKEELLKMLRDAGMSDGEIESMLEEIIVELKPGEEKEMAEPVPAEDEEAKEHRVFGI